MGGHDVMNDLNRQFEQLLRDELRDDRSVVAMLVRRLDAMRSSPPAELTACCRAAEPGVRQVCDLERRRLQVLAELTRLIAPGSRDETGLSAIASRLMTPLSESVSPIGDCPASAGQVTPQPARPSRTTHSYADVNQTAIESSPAAMPLNTTA